MKVSQLEVVPDGKHYEITLTMSRVLELDSKDLYRITCERKRIRACCQA